MTDLLGKQVLRLGRRSATEIVTPDPMTIKVKSPSADPRAVEMKMASEVNDQILRVVKERLSGIIVDPDALGDIATAVTEVHRYYRGMRDDAVRIGRLLSRVRRNSSVAYGALFRGEGSPMPFSESVASRMVAIADAVDTGKVELNRLPMAYSAAYEIVTLAKSDPDGFREADEQGLIAPETRRETVLEFKRNRQTKNQSTNTEEAMLIDERRKLSARILEIDARLKTIAESRFVPLHRDGQLESS
jgi:hypothetical protein